MWLECWGLILCCVAGQVPYSQSLPFSKGLPPPPPSSPFFTKYPYQRPLLPYVKTPIKPFVHHHHKHHPHHHPPPFHTKVKALPVIHPSAIEQFEHHEGIHQEEVRSLQARKPFVSSLPQRFPSPSSTIPKLIFSPLQKVVIWTFLVFYLFRILTLQGPKPILVEIGRQVIPGVTSIEFGHSISHNPTNLILTTPRPSIKNQGTFLVNSGHHSSHLTQVPTSPLPAASQPLPARPGPISPRRPAVHTLQGPNNIRIIIFPSPIIW